MGTACKKHSRFRRLCRIATVFTDSQDLKYPTQVLLQRHRLSPQADYIPVVIIAGDQRGTNKGTELSGTEQSRSLSPGRLGKLRACEGKRGIGPVERSIRPDLTSCSLRH